MRAVLLSLVFIALAPCLGYAYRYDARLSAVLKKDFARTIKKTASGREFYARLEAAGPEAAKMRVLVRRNTGRMFAWFDVKENAVYLNSDTILKFFSAKHIKDAESAHIIYSNKEVRAELVKYADALYLHELTHALQTYKYPHYRLDIPEANPVEFEYEAYLTEDLYTHEKLKNSPKLLKDFISGAYYDMYTENSLGSYLALSLDPDAYKEKIRKKYEEELGGYISLEQAEGLQKNSLANSKILAYASGSSVEYAGKSDGLAALQKEREAYAAFLKDFYGRVWPVLSSEALLFVGTTAMEVKNYPLALDCLAVADENSPKYDLSQKALAELKTKGALAVLEAEAFIKDNAAKMGVEELGQHLKALEKACAKTARPFPEALYALRAGNYPKAYARYNQLYDREKNPEKRAFYRENRDYFEAFDGAKTGGRSTDTFNLN